MGINDIHYYKDEHFQQFIPIILVSIPSEMDTGQAV